MPMLDLSTGLVLFILLSMRQAVISHMSHNPSRGARSPN